MPSLDVQHGLYDTISLNEYQIGDGAASVSNPLYLPGRGSQYIWTADELLAAGMNAGDITGMQVYINEAGSLAQDRSYAWR